MNRVRTTGLLYLVIGVALAGLSACGGDDSPTGPSVTVSAPSVVRPASGEEIPLAQPTLVARNATASDGSTPTYAFQVATDSAFSTIVAEARDIAQGPGGETAWTVSTPLANGQHFWRVRARAGSTESPFSQAADFRVFTAFLSREPREGILVFDPLTSGTTVGVLRGGEFTAQGWKVLASSNYILYDLPTIENGFLEFDVTGLDIRNPTRDARHIFIMWDPSQGSDFTMNPFRASLQKLDNRSSINDRWLRFRFITQGRQVDASSTFRDWDATNTYHIRFEWGREDALVGRLLVDQRELIFFQYPRPYIPSLHRVELGAAPRAESPEGAIYSNVRIGIRQ